MVKFERYPAKPANSSGDERWGPQLSPIVRKLYEAIAKCQYKKVKYLLENCSAKITSRNQFGHTVLIAALHIHDDNYRFRMLKYLIKHGANPLTKDNGFDRNCLLWSCALARCEETRYLLSEYSGELDLSEADNDGITALHHAVLVGSMDIVKMLLSVFDKYHLSVDIPDRLGLTPYMQARRLGYYDIALVLKKDGRASPHRRDLLMFKTGTEWSQIGKLERQEERLEKMKKEIAWTKVIGRAPRLRRGYGLPAGYRLRDNAKLPPISTEDLDEKESAILSEPIPDGKSTSLSNRSLPENLLDVKPDDNVQDTNKVTMSLMDMADNGRRVKHFHKSQAIDIKSDTSVLDNIGSMLEILVEQSSESFRKSVEKPLIVPEVIVPQKKPKVSSLAIVMGRKRNDRVPSRRSRLDRRDTQKSRLTVIKEGRPVSKERRGSKRTTDNTGNTNVSDRQEQSMLRSQQLVLPEIKT